MSISIRSLPQRVTLKLRANVPESINIEAPSQPARGMRIQNFTTTDVYWDTSPTVAILTAKGVVRPNTASGEFRTIDISAGTWVVTFLSATAGDLEIDIAAEPFEPESVGQALGDFEAASTTLLESIETLLTQQSSLLTQLQLQTSPYVGDSYFAGPVNVNSANGASLSTFFAGTFRFEWIRFKYNTSATVTAGNRLPFISWRNDAGNEIIRLRAITQLAQSSGAHYAWGRGLGYDRQVNFAAWQDQLALPEGFFHHEDGALWIGADNADITPPTDTLTELSFRVTNLV